MTRVGQIMQDSEYVLHADSSDRVIIANFRNMDMAERVIKTGFTDIHSIEFYPGRRLFTVAGGSQGIVSHFVLNEIPCEDPLALTCHLVQPAISTSCLANA
jgi:hypothetical protein